MRKKFIQITKQTTWQNIDVVEEAIHVQHHHRAQAHHLAHPLHRAQVHHQVDMTHGMTNHTTRNAHAKDVEMPIKSGARELKIAKVKSNAGDKNISLTHTNVKDQLPTLKDGDTRKTLNANGKELNQFTQNATFARKITRTALARKIIVMVKRNTIKDLSHLIHRFF